MTTEDKHLTPVEEVREWLADPEHVTHPEFAIRRLIAMAEERDECVRMIYRAMGGVWQEAMVRVASGKALRYEDMSGLCVQMGREYNLPVPSGLEEPVEGGEKPSAPVLILPDDLRK